MKSPTSRAWRVTRDIKRCEKYLWWPFGATPGGRQCPVNSDRQRTHFRPPHHLHQTAIFLHLQLFSTLDGTYKLIRHNISCRRFHGPWWIASFRTMLAPAVDCTRTAQCSVDCIVHIQMIRGLLRVVQPVDHTLKHLEATLMNSGTVFGSCQHAVHAPCTAPQRDHDAGRGQQADDCLGT